MKIAKSYRIEEKLVEDIETVSKAQNRSATNLIETVMKDYCKLHLPISKSGNLKTPKPALGKGSKK